MNKPERDRIIKFHRNGYTVCEIARITHYQSQLIQLIITAHEKEAN